MALSRIEIARPVDPIKAAYEKAVFAAALEIGDLANRQSFPQIASLCVRDFAKECFAPGSVIQVLVEGGPLDTHTYRMGTLFGVMPLASSESYAPLERLRSMDSFRARIVRSLVGDLDWSDTTHRAERAAGLLRALVRARLGGDTP